MSDLVVSVKFRVSLLLSGNCFLKSGTVEGKKNVDCGFENFTLQGF